MTFADALSLGRVSNLPTVWTNMITGLVLGAAGLGGMLAPGEHLLGSPLALLPALFLALTLFYVGGMYLNDFFDAGIDAVERPQRPIPSGRVAARTVAVAGFTMLGLGIAAMFYVARTGTTGGWPVIAGAALAGCIVLYDGWHKNNPLSPLVMGACRVLVYLCAGVSVVVPVPAALIAAAAALLCYLIGLTYVAKQENLDRVRNLWPLAFLAVPVAYGIALALHAAQVWPFLALLCAWVLVALYFIRRRGPGDIPRAVVSLIAGVSLLDAMLVAAAGAQGLALLCVVGFALTLVLQRYVAGT